MSREDCLLQNIFACGLNVLSEIKFLNFASKLRSSNQRDLDAQRSTLDDTKSIFDQIVLDTKSEIEESERYNQFKIVSDRVKSKNKFNLFIIDEFYREIQLREKSLLDSEN